MKMAEKPPGLRPFQKATLAELLEESRRLREVSKKLQKQADELSREIANRMQQKSDTKSN